MCAGEYVGLEEIDDGIWNVYLTRVLVAREWRSLHKIRIKMPVRKLYDALHARLARRIICVGFKSGDIQAVRRNESVISARERGGKVSGLERSATTISTASLKRAALTGSRTK